MHKFIALAFTVTLASSLSAQVPNPTQQMPQSGVPQTGEAGTAVPIFRVTVVQRTTKAVNYQHRSGWINIDFRGTELMPQAKGKAEVNSRKGYTEIKADLQKLDPPVRFGPEYLTYVMWAVSPDGRATNLGEIVLDDLDDHKGKLNVTTEMQTFGLIVTAEPYYAVQQPSDVVVMENFIRPDTYGTIEQIDAKYELLKRGQYSLNKNPSMVSAVPRGPKEPLALVEARNALRIAQWTGADKYAGDTYQAASVALRNAEDMQRSKGESKRIIMNAREAVQRAEDAREIAIKRMDEERLAQERADAAAREQRAREQAEEAARQRQAEEQKRLAAEEERRAAAQRAATAEQERLAAERAKAEALAAAQQAAQQKAEADKARLEAEQARQQLAAEADRAKQAAQEADRLRLRAEEEKQQLREQIRQQLNTILETRETARGLIVNMSDVLFDTGRYTLKAGTREKLAKVAGILLAHPGLRVEVEGHTDSVGGDEYNQRLSEQRAGAVRDYLVGQGLPMASISALGFGKTRPVATNDTAAGRQQNRRVELVVSGEPIMGTTTSTTTTTTTVPRQ